jgi:hypothetical protein
VVLAMTSTPPQPEFWLRGPVPGVPTSLQPVAHGLLQALDDAERLTADLHPEELWTAPGGAATIGFHLRHATGSLDRLLTYARGAPLSEEQRAAFALEDERSPEVAADELIERLRTTVQAAVEQLRTTDEADLDGHRAVGRARLPSSVRGLLHHASEHTARHVGQISTTVKVVRGLRRGPSG